VITELALRPLVAAVVVVVVVVVEVVVDEGFDEVSQPCRARRGSRAAANNLPPGMSLVGASHKI